MNNFKSVGEADTKIIHHSFFIIHQKKAAR